MNDVPGIQRHPTSHESAAYVASLRTLILRRQGHTWIPRVRLDWFVQAKLDSDVPLSLVEGRTGAAISGYHPWEVTSPREGVPEGVDLQQLVTDSVDLRGKKGGIPR